MTRRSEWTAKGVGYLLWSALFVVFGCAWWTYACVAQTPKAPKDMNSDSSREALDEAVKRFATALKDQDSDALLQQFSKNGVVFGVDSDPLKWRDIQRKMKAKGDLYCLFFDSTCLRQRPGFEKQTALRDILVGGKVYQTKVAVKNESNQHVGFVRLFVEGNPNRATQGQEFCNLTYSLERDSWKLTEVQYY